MKVWRKLAAAVMAATILFGSLTITGCWKKKKGETISEDDPWYTVEKLDISAPYMKKYKNLEYFDVSFLGKDGDNNVFVVNAQEPIPNDFDWEKDDYSSYNHYEVASYNAAGEIVNSINLMDYADNDSEYFSNIAYLDGKVKLTILNYSDFKSSKCYTTDVDLKDGKASKRVEIKDGDTANEGSVTIGDITIGKNYYSDDNKSSYQLFVLDASGKQTTIDLGKQFPDKDIYNIDSIFKTDASNALIACSGDDGMLYINLNLSDFSVKKCKEDDIKWLEDTSMYEISTLSSGSYSLDQYSIKKLDFEKKELTEVFNFNYCNLSRYDSGNCQMIDITDNQIVLLQSINTYSSYTSSNTEYNLLTLTKSDKNPNAGKVIIDILCLQGVSESVSSAVCDFNDTNKDYFIRYASGYDFYENLNWTDDMTNEEWEKKVLQAEAEMSNKLAIDLMNGDGPDIIVGGSMYGQLNNDSYLVDVSSRMSKASGNYFSNIIDGSKNNGKLYQVPLCFYVQGIITDSKNVSKDQQGFTFEQYAKFVDEVCNGKDPIYGSQVSYLTLLSDNMNDIFISGNKANYNNDAFKDLCKYVKDNVNEKNDEDDVEIYDYEEEYIPDAAQQCYISDIESYIGYLETYSGAKSLSLLGLPSSDGRGATICISDSVGISAQAVDEDACWQFIELLLSESSQKLYAKSTFCVNIDAYESCANESIENYNKMYSEDNYSFSGRPANQIKVDKSLVTDFETNCISKGHVLNSDPSINVIIAEEIPAYLSGQKKIDDVISIIENRSNTVLGER